MMDPPAPVFRLHEEHLQLMREQALSCLPEEACGLISGELRGGVWQAAQIHPVTNELHSSTRFRMAPKEQWSVLKSIDENNESLIGIYHSHPQGPPEPSTTDLLEFAYPGVVYLIWSQDEDKWLVRAFVMDNSAAREVKILIVPKN